MNPTRQRRLIIVAVVTVAAAVAAGLGVYALQHNMNYLLTPSQVQSGEAASTRHSASAAWSRPVRSSARHFAESHVHRGRRRRRDAVEYTGILPDLFRDNQSVIATGHMDSASFSSPPKCWPSTTRPTCPRS